VIRRKGQLGRRPNPKKPTALRGAVGVRDCESAKQELNHAGRMDDDMISASGDEVVHFAEDHLLNDGLWECR